MFLNNICRLDDAVSQHQISFVTTRGLGSRIVFESRMATLTPDAIVQMMQTHRNNGNQVPSNFSPVLQVLGTKMPFIELMLGSPFA
jgi:hypothetical protein